MADYRDDSENYTEDEGFAEELMEPMHFPMLEEDFAMLKEHARILNCLRPVLLPAVLQRFNATIELVSYLHLSLPECLIRIIGGAAGCGSNIITDLSYKIKRLKLAGFNRDFVDQWARRLIAAGISEYSNHLTIPRVVEMFIRNATYAVIAASPTSPSIDIVHNAVSRPVRQVIELDLCEVKTFLDSHNSADRTNLYHATSWEHMPSFYRSGVDRIQTRNPPTELATKPAFYMSTSSFFVANYSAVVNVTYPNQAILVFSVPNEQLRSQRVFEILTDGDRWNDLLRRNLSIHNGPNHIMFDGYGFVKAPICVHFHGGKNSAYREKNGRLIYQYAALTDSACNLLTDNWIYTIRVRPPKPAPKPVPIVKKKPEVQIDAQGFQLVLKRRRR